MDIIKALLKVFFGLLLMLVGIFGLVKYWNEFLDLLQASVPALVILIGLVFLLVGFSDIKSD